MTLQKVKEYVKSIKAPKEITSMAQAVDWTFRTLSRVRGMLTNLYYDKGSMDFTKGLLQDSENGV